MHLPTLLFSLIFAALISCIGHGQSLGTPAPNPALLDHHWKAQWINHPSESAVDYGVFHFRKSFELASVPASFIIHVSADNRYRLFVNGSPVCAGPARGDLAHWYYESIDIAAHLRPGKNLLAACVWNYSESKPWAQFSLKTALIVQGDGPAEQLVNTDASWKTLKNLAFTAVSKQTHANTGEFSVVGPGDQLDAARHPWGWESPAHDDSAWPAAKTIDCGHPRGIGTDINWVLTPRRVPPMEQHPQRFESIRRVISATGLQPPADFLKGSIPWTIPPHQTLSILLDQQNLTVGYPELLTSLGKGSKIELTYAESLFDAQGIKHKRDQIDGKTIRGYADIFLPDGGKDRLFRPLWLRTWRYIQLDIQTSDQPLILLDMQSEFSAYPLAQNAAFVSDAPALKPIWDVGWRTARLCAGETYFDCPYYEQLQYIGDTRIQALISLYVSGDARLVKHALMTFNESRTYEGLTQSRYPSASPQVIPTFSLFWVSMIHDYWMLRDDPAFVESLLPGIDSVLGWFIRRIDPTTGLLGKCEFWNFVDWADAWPWLRDERIGGVPSGGRGDGQSAILTMQLAYALQHAAQLHRHFPNPTQVPQAERYEKLASALTRAVRDACWDAKRGYLADSPAKMEFSMHGQIFGVLTDTIPAAEQKALTLRMLDDKSLIQPTLYFRFYLTQALVKTHLADHFLATLQPWQEMLDSGLTTFAEKPDPTRSDCHAWSASPNYDFLATVAGIRPATPGFRKVQITPALGPLQSIHGHMPHPAGKLSFALKRTGKSGINGQITLPPGISGQFTWHGTSLPLTGTTTIDLAE